MSLLEWIAPEPNLALEGEGVRLRPPRRKDYSEWAALRQASRGFLQPWEPTWAPDELSLVSFQRRLTAWRRGRELDQMYAFFVYRKADGALTGGVTLNNVRRGVAQTATVGYWSGQTTARNGHTLAAVKTLIPFAFGPLGLHRLEAACLPTNDASGNLLLKAGFTEEGYAKAYLKINGDWRDHRLFGLVSRGVSRGRPREGLPG
ncbi:GNAT family N-acetyltransferase [Caulobacter mirabilis]|uniref:30S ribosomal protein S5 alanine N-acetyltransferase n=1 Tax=Caulobacter mirabilis TaxID=69666 RepID=A0A2D2B1Z1_9CAUL|nr:GNAT family protein [Caulobacter mirabilis]ATQ44238.1 30S ribosomal protein S5 alanine N-acetyltransferase [Caulobacter mirabilis]